ncbi:hypothetical protein NDU88_005354 [Pleurodeles waltl]|uniref:Uncharacterized protein n=1 Tax=Pleurodeles waltl TaxID=8319 RepID=A0AAV7NS16_PLEWA|nr:hypothetical protein NDU88_005353 [Pleurodeles waltl]KAJ1117154.1 hypothetical protein NDU88_005354 [Pleurodeles waltl]
MSSTLNRREQRNAKLDQVFNTSDTGTPNLGNTNLTSARSTFLALKKSLKKETAKWWEVASLKKYLEHDRIPRGLRILIFPPTDTTSQESLQKWEANLKMASMNMIHQLIDISQEQYEHHKQEVDQLTQRIEEANWGDISTKNYAILNNIIDNYEADIIQRKNRKFRRDLRDYQQGRVYTFSKKYDNVQDPNPPMDTLSCPDTIPSSEVETSEDSDKESSIRPGVNFLEEARRFRLGSLQETRTKLPDISAATPGTSGIQTRARSKNLRPLNTTTN